MKRGLLWAAALQLAGAGSLWAQTQDGKVEGTNNAMTVSLPASYDAGKKWPLAILLHGAGDKQDNCMRWYLQSAELKEHFILCAVKSTKGSWAIEDEAVILAAVMQMKKEYSVDERQVWLAGFSAGASMTALVGTKNTDAFAGMVIMAGFQNPSSKLPEYKTSLKEDYFYLLVGDKDQALNFMRGLNREIDEAGSRTKKYVEVPGMGHTCRREDAVDIGKWMLESTRKISEGQPKRK